MSSKKDGVGFYWPDEQPQKESDMVLIPPPPPGLRATADPKANLTPERVRQILDVRTKRDLILRSVSDVEMRAIDWLWPGWIPIGYLTIWAGETGTGKTTLLTEIAARVTTGNPWPLTSGPQQREAAHVLWLASEDGTEDMTKPRLVACGADTTKITEILGVRQAGQRKAFSLQDDIAQIRAHLALQEDRGKKVVLLVIDPITSYLHGTQLKRVDLNDAGQLRTVLEPWMALAQEFNLAIVCVTHFAKDTARQMLHRVLGSGAFVHTCRSLCAVIDDENADEPFRKLLVQVKTNLPERPRGALRFRTEAVAVGADPKTGKPIVATRPVWEGVDEGFSASMSPKKPGPPSTYGQTFGIWLQAFFMAQGGDVALPVSQVKEAAIRDKAASQRWWDDHSKDYLERDNRQGTWYCWRKKQL